MQDYVDCARRFQLRYIEQLRWPAVETAPVLENERRQLEGQQFHRLVQQHILGLPAEGLSRLANTPDLSRWWENYLHVSLDLPAGGCSTELVLVAPIGEYRLVAKYDLVVVHTGGKATIYDWKTYMKWHYVHGATSALSKKFVDEGFDFFLKTLQGQSG